jgi:Rps23 Pro-64 3,4-dihydroxylase Tpa1-like proline 4-hydroxylase
MSAMNSLTNRVTRRHAIGDREIVVIDDLFDEPFTRMVHHYMSRLQFAMSGYDTPETKHALHWSHEFDIGNPSSLPLIGELFSTVLAVANELYGSSALHLHRAHCNAHLYGDMQYPHTDLEPGATALYYVNHRWETNWLGETIFYDDNREPLYAVAPKPGRLVVFSADIVHRGGVPSRECHEPRLTVAFKFFKQR